MTKAAEASAIADVQNSVDTRQIPIDKVVSVREDETGTQS